MITIGEIAGNLIEGSSFITRLMVAACVALGSALIFTSLLMYKKHRENPKFIPLDRPVVYFFLGVLAVSLPFFGQIFGPYANFLDTKRHQKETVVNYTNI